MSNISLSISIPAAMRKTIQKQVVKGQFGTPSEYLRHLVREDARRSQEVRAMDDFIQAGIDSGPSDQSPEEIFAEAEANIERVAKSKKK